MRHQDFEEDLLDALDGDELQQNVQVIERAVEMKRRMLKERKRPSKRWKN